jgi:hypothetical protein
MSYSAEIDPAAQEALDEAKAGGNGSFPPLPGGKYQAVVMEVQGVAEFGGKTGNAKKKVLKVKVQIVADSPLGKNRVYFERVPLFTRYAPTDKNPNGATARGFWDFFGKAIGWPDEKLLANDLPTLQDIQGKRITVTLSAPIPPDNYNALGSNEVAFWDKEGALTSTPTGPVKAAWLDANGELKADGVAPATPRAQTPPPAPQAPPAAPQAPSVPSVPAPAYNAPEAPAAPAAPAGAWGAADAEAPPTWGVDPADVAAAAELVPA